MIGSEAFEADPDFYVYGAAHTAAEGLTWVEGRHTAGSSLAFPSTVMEGASDSSLWFGPNFLILDAAD